MAKITGVSKCISLERLVNIMRLAVTWEIAGYVDVEANTLEDAMERFKKESDYVRLPNGDYLERNVRALIQRG